MIKMSTLVSGFTSGEFDTELRETLNTENLVEFITARLPGAGQPLADAAAHHFQKSGKMLHSL